MKKELRNTMPDLDGPINDTEDYQLVTGRRQQGFEKLAWQLNDLGLDAVTLMPKILHLATQEIKGFEVEQQLLFGTEKLSMNLCFRNDQMPPSLSGLIASLGDVSRSFRQDMPADICFEQLKAIKKNHLIDHLNFNTTNTQNFEFLKKTLLNLGFSEDSKLNKALEEKIKAKEPEFILATSYVFDRKNVDYDLHFKAGENQDNYFFNKYDAKVFNENPEKDVTQTFYINKGSGVTAKEAFNLMEGRSVHKQLFNLEGQKYNAWLTLDDKNLTENGNRKIKHYHENYGFDVEKVISGKGIKEMVQPENKSSLLYSLKKGNLTHITLEKNGENKSYYITANPQFKTVDLFDAGGRKIKREDLLQPDQKTVKSLKKREQQKEELPAKKQSRKSKMHV